VNELFNPYPTGDLAKYFEGDLAKETYEGDFA
jgi:hypothetical protein